jgi:hypothetical protein
VRPDNIESTPADVSLLSSTTRQREIEMFDCATAAAGCKLAIKVHADSLERVNDAPRSARAAQWSEQDEVEDAAAELTWLSESRLLYSHLMVCQVFLEHWS